jgi:hypothetical protein
MQVQREQTLWSKFMCIQGRHKVSNDDKRKLADLSIPKIPSSCIYCGHELSLIRDPYSPKEFFIEEV